MTFVHPDLMPQMVARRARENAGGVAFKHVDGAVLSWGEAYSDSLRWASGLERLGARRGQPVVTVFANSFDAFVDQGDALFRAGLS